MKKGFIPVLLLILVFSSLSSAAFTPEEVAQEWFANMLFGNIDELEALSTEKFWSSAGPFMPILLMAMKEAKDEFAPGDVDMQTVMSLILIHSEVRGEEIGDDVHLLSIMDETESIMSFIILNENGEYKVGLIM